MGNITTHSVTNGDTGTGIVNSKQKEEPFGPSSGEQASYGYPEDGDVVSEYLINIYSKRLNTNIVSTIQDKVGLRVTSEWRAVFGVGAIRQTLQQFLQLGTRRALTSKWATRRMWMGSSPISLTLPLKFAAINDAYFEVLLPLIKLQQMALPAQAKNNVGGSAGLGSKAYNMTRDLFSLEPPGPDPYQASFLDNIRNIRGEGLEEISIEVGKLFRFPSVIIRDVAVEMSDFAKGGYPTNGVATVSFETFEMVTKEDLYGTGEAFYKPIRGGGVSGQAPDSGLIYDVLPSSGKGGDIK